MGDYSRLNVMYILAFEDVAVVHVFPRLLLHEVLLLSTKLIGLPHV